MTESSAPLTRRQRTGAAMLRECLRTETTANRAPGQYLLVVPHYWGRGRTIAEALKQMRDAGGSVAKQFRLWWQSDDAAMKEAPAGATAEQRGMVVDGAGRLCWYGDRPSLVFSFDA